MRPASTLLCSVAIATACGVATAGPVDDLRAGADLRFEPRGFTYSYSGALSGAGEVAEDEVPPACVEKAPGELDITLDLADLGFPGSAVVTFTGEDQGGGVVRWTVDQVIDICTTVNIDGSDVDVLIHRVTGALTADAERVAPVFDDLCERIYNVLALPSGGDSGNFLDIIAYAFCVQSIFTRVDFQVREFDHLIRGGVPTPDLNADGQVNGADLAILLTAWGASQHPADLNQDGTVTGADLAILLTNWGPVSN